MKETTLKPISNIAIKSKYIQNSARYLPYDLLPKGYRDARSFDLLTEYQRKQQYKLQFMATHLKKEDD